MTGNAYSGLWYTIAVVAFGLLVAWWGIPTARRRTSQTRMTEASAHPKAARTGRARAELARARPSHVRRGQVRLKADCYGLGAKLRTGPRNAGCRDFFVAHWSRSPLLPMYRQNFRCCTVSRCGRGYARPPACVGHRQPPPGDLGRERQRPCHLMVDTDQSPRHQRRTSAPPSRPCVEVLMSHRLCR